MNEHTKEIFLKEDTNPSVNSLEVGIQNKIKVKILETGYI